MSLSRVVRWGRDISRPYESLRFAKVLELLNTTSDIHYIFENDSQTIVTTNSPLTFDNANGP